MKKLSLSMFILLLFVACETGYKGEPNSTKEESVSFTTNKPKASYLEYKEPLDAESLDSNFSSETREDGLDIGTIRVSEKKDSVRLVFDNYRWNLTSEYLGEKVDTVGSYNFDYSPEKLLITATLDGYSAFSAQLPKFNKDSIVEEIYFDESLDNNGYKFYIKLRYDSEVKVFSLKNPARIVVDITLL
ncbi:hypothetical protein MNB_SV-12-180 [hydrothermal vent metagenome]|uniref:Lipoprotein n=1 Tax=hydrothermal vent metagenome TaxID=652676 RepID=A0A1W1BTV3_9ZZZZ